MGIEPKIDEPVEDSIRGDLEKAFEQVEKPADEQIQHAEDKNIEKPSSKELKVGDRGPDGKFIKSGLELRKELPPLAEEAIKKPPSAWMAADRIAEWEAMTPKQREVLIRREEEVDFGFKKLDEERNFGKSLKNIVQPYMATIQAEGGTPETAIQSLLNTAYILRTAPQSQKTALFHQLAQQYGVDLSQPNNTTAVQPNDMLMQTQRELAQLKQQIQQQPEVFRQQQENLVIKSQIDAFAADPKNVHYEKLKPIMAALLQAGQAKDMQDAYDKASWADPDIRSALNSDQQKASEAQRIGDIKAQTDKARKLAVSVKGSPSINPVPPGKSNGSIREDLEAAFELHA